MGIFFWFIISTVLMVYGGQMYMTITLPDLKEVYIKSGAAPRIETKFHTFLREGMFNVVQTLNHAIQLGTGRCFFRILDTRAVL